MFCPSDDLILEIYAQVAEVIAIARHPYDEIAVMFRVLLCRAQGGSIHYIELDVVSVKLKVGAHEVNQTVQAGVVVKQLRRELLVKQGATRAGVVHFGRRFDDSRWSMPIGALYRRDPL